MWGPSYGKADIESGGPALYPMMTERPDLRWAFIRKIYVILSIQLLLTVAVASIVVTVHPISHFFVSSPAGLALYIVLIIIPFIGILFLFFSLFPRIPFPPFFSFVWKLETLNSSSSAVENNFASRFLKAILDFTGCKLRL